MSDAESGSELAETDSQRPKHRPTSTLSLGQKRGGLRAAKVSRPGLPQTCPLAPPVQGQPRSPVPPCGGAGHASLSLTWGPLQPLAWPRAPTRSSLLTHPLPFSFHFFCLLVSPPSLACTYLYTHTHHSSRGMWAGVTARACARTHALLCILVIFGAHVLSRPLSARSCSVSSACSPRWLQPRPPPCPAGPERSQEPQPRFLAHTGHLQGQHWGAHPPLCTLGADEVRHGAPSLR